MRTNLKDLCFGIVLAVLTVALIVSPLFCEAIYPKNTNDEQSLIVQPVKTFDGYNKGYLSPDGTKIALKSKSYLEIDDLKSGKQLSRITPTGNVLFFSAAFSPDGKLIAGSYNVSNGINEPIMKISIWETATGKEVRTLVSFNSGRIPQTISFSADGSLITAFANVARVWRVDTGQEIHASEYLDALFYFDSLLSPNGKWLMTLTQSEKAAFGSSVLQITDFETKKEKALNVNFLDGWTFSDDSTVLIVNGVQNFRDQGNTSRRFIEFLDTKSWKSTSTIELQKYIYSLDLSGDKQLLLVGESETFSILNASSGKLLNRTYHHKRTFNEKIKKVSDIYFLINHVEFSSDSKTLLTSGEDNKVKIWRIVIK